MKGAKYLNLYTGEKEYLDNAITRKGPEKPDFAVSVPHSGVWIPEFSLEKMRKDIEHIEDVDKFTDRLYDMTDKGGSLIKAELYRNVVELNKDIKEGKFKKGERKVIPYVNLDGEEILIKPYSLENMEFLVNYYKTFHGMLDKEIEKLIERYGKAFLLDGHSMSPNIRKLSKQKVNYDRGKPDFCVGTLDGESAEKGIVNTFTEALRERVKECGLNPEDVKQDYPFKGGYIPRRIHNTKEGRNVIAVETNQRLYAKNDKTPIQENIELVNGILAGAVEAVVENHIKRKIV